MSTNDYGIVFLNYFEVDCDGSACGSGPDVPRHIHPPQYTGKVNTRVIVRDGEVVGKRPAEGITRLIGPAL